MKGKLSVSELDVLLKKYEYLYASFIVIDEASFVTKFRLENCVIENMQFREPSFITAKAIFFDSTYSANT